jgi:hypothetical protein
MKRAALLLLVAASTACQENIAHDMPPMDRFTFPTGVALTAVAGGNQALVVVSANFDLRYDKQEGATVLSVDPGVYDQATGTGGSAGRPDGALVKLGPGAQLGSYAGPVAVVDARTCPGWTAAPLAFSASRYTRLLYTFPIGDDGSVAPCQRAHCGLNLDPDILDPAAIGVACRSDAARRSLFVGYLHAPPVEGRSSGTAWLTEFDLDQLGGSRTFALSPGPVGEMAYDGETDRLYAVGRFAGLVAPLFVLDLTKCRFDPDPTQNTCATPLARTVDLYSSVRGAELVSIALSNPQPGRPRLAYIAASIYDEAYALAIRGRPSFDLGGALLVVELDENLAGGTLARVRQVVPIGLGAGSVRVLPVRPGLGDLVVVPSSGDGSVYVFDDEIQRVSRIVTLDQSTGAPEAGHIPYSMAVEDRGTEALVYIAAFTDGTVSVLRVPMADPASADMVRYPASAGTSLAGKPVRIGRPQ